MNDDKFIVFENDFRWQVVFCGGPCYFETGAEEPVQFAINVFVTSLKSTSAMKIMEGDNDWFKALLLARSTFGLDDNIFEVWRAEQDGKFRFYFKLIGPIDVDLRRRILQTLRHDLVKEYNLAHGGRVNE